MDNTSLFDVKVSSLDTLNLNTRFEMLFYFSQELTIT